MTGYRAELVEEEKVLGNWTGRWASGEEDGGRGRQGERQRCGVGRQRSAATTSPAHALHHGLP